MTLNITELEKSILFWIYENKGIDYTYHNGKQMRLENTVIYKDCIYNLAKKLNKLVDGNKGRRIEKAFYKELNENIDSLIKKKLLIESFHSYWGTRYIELTDEGKKIIKKYIIKE